MRILSTISNKRFSPHQVAYLQCRIWGKSNERFIKEGPQQHRLDFDDLELLPEEQEEARFAAAEEEAITWQNPDSHGKRKSKPAHKTIPENIYRVDEHIYLQNINPEEWIELKLEITEVLEHKPEEFFVRRIIHHKYIARDKSSQMKSTIITATLPCSPIVKSYVEISLLAKFMVRQPPSFPSSDTDI